MVNAVDIQTVINEALDIDMGVDTDLDCQNGTNSIDVQLVILAALDIAIEPCEPGPIDYRREMRDFVQAISAYAKGKAENFIVIPQNGEALLTLGADDSGAPPAADYIAAIDGQGREDLFYGYNFDDVATPTGERDYLLGFLDLAERSGVEALVTDYCSTRSKVDNSYAQNAARGFISFAANHRELDTIPPYPDPIFNSSTADIASLSDAKNFLYVLSPDGVGNGRDGYLAALAATDYDLLIIDLFAPFGEGVAALTPAEVNSLRTKGGGGSRLVIAYMSIGEAEDYRYYWQPGWGPGSPEWLEAENPDWPGNYKTRYWDPAWQAIIFGDSSAYLDRILAVGFDGVYLDIIDAYEYFEQLKWSNAPGVVR